MYCGLVCGVTGRFVFFKQKTAYEMRISDWSSDVCSSDLTASIALTNPGETPLYAAEAAAALVGTPVEKAAVDKAVALAEGITAPASDGRGNRKSTRLNSSH